MRHAIISALRPAYHLARRALIPPEPKSPIAETPQDDIFMWMRFINPGMLHKGNIDLFAHCIERLPTNDPVIEIGSFAGLSLNHINMLLKRSGRANLVFSVDAWQFENARPSCLIDGSSISFDDYRSHVIETFKRNVVLFSADRLPHHITMDSDHFFASWKGRERHVDFFDRHVTLGGPISFAYIDGAHTYEQSMRDFENVDSCLVPGGFIVFDDSADNSDWGSNRTARESVTLARYRLVAKNPNYCIQKTD